MFFTHSDWIGTERARTNPLGEPCLYTTSEPFGDDAQSTTPAGGTSCNPSPNFLTGKQRDAESGLDDFGARYFSSQWGRWMSPDWSTSPTTVPYATLGNPQSLNLYGYVGNDPISGQDPDGHFTYIWDDPTGGGDSFGDNDDGFAKKESQDNLNRDQTKPGSGDEGTNASQNTSSQKTPDGDPAPPPVDPPRGTNGEKNSWVLKKPSGTGDRTEAWESKYPTNKQTGSKAGASWDIGDTVKGIPGHWDIDNGWGTRGHYTPDGTQIDHWGTPSRETAGLPISKQQAQSAAAGAATGAVTIAIIWEIVKILGEAAADAAF